MTFLGIKKDHYKLYESAPADLFGQSAGRFFTISNQERT
jgi:hypothetical protein